MVFGPFFNIHPRWEPFGTGFDFPFVCLVSNTRSDVSWYSDTFSTYMHDGKPSVTGFDFPFVSLLSNTRSDVSWNSDTFSTYMHDGRISFTGFDFPFVGLVRKTRIRAWRYHDDN